LMAVITVATLSAYPLAPIQLTVISTLTIGVPGFFLAFAPNARRYLPGFLHRVVRFSVPTGLITGAAAYAGYAVTRWLLPEGGVAAARTTATIVVLLVGLWTLVILARPLTAWKTGLVASMAGVAFLVVAVPVVAESIVLLSVSIRSLAIAAGIGAVGAVLVEVSHRALPVSAAAAGRPSRTPLHAPSN
jgi:cation-transporting ATPase E